MKVAKDNKKDESAGDAGTDAESNIGKLASVAPRILMKILYGARMAKYDLLRPVCHLACYLTKWTEECDKRLHKLMCWINSSLDYRMVGWVGAEETLESINPHLYADSDLGGCLRTQRSTSGVYQVT